MKHFRVDRMSEVATVEELRLGKFMIFIIMV